eukprot:1186997-Prorocentrum_minimum.AAC.1
MGCIQHLLRTPLPDTIAPAILLTAPYALPNAYADYINPLEHVAYCFYYVLMTWTGRCPQVWGHSGGIFVVCEGAAECGEKTKVSLPRSASAR